MFPETALLKAVVARPRPHTHADDRAYKMSVLLLVSGLAHSFRGPLVPRRPESVRDSQGLMVDTDQLLERACLLFQSSVSRSMQAHQNGKLHWLGWYKGSPLWEDDSFCSNTSRVW